MSVFKYIFMLSLIMSNLLYASERPTIQQTQGYITEIIFNKEKAKIENIYLMQGSKDSDTLEKFVFTNECKILFQTRNHAEHESRKNDIVSEYQIDLSKHKSSVDKDEDFGKVHYINFTDRRGMKTIKEIFWHSGDKNNKSIYTSDYKNIQLYLYGVYPEKLDKALKHLSDICYEKYRNKSKELF